MSSMFAHASMIFELSRNFKMAQVGDEILQFHVLRMSLFLNKLHQTSGRRTEYSSFSFYFATADVTRKIRLSELP